MNSKETPLDGFVGMPRCARCNIPQSEHLGPQPMLCTTFVPSLLEDETTEYDADNEAVRLRVAMQRAQRAETATDIVAQVLAQYVPPVRDPTPLTDYTLADDAQIRSQKKLAQDIVKALAPVLSSE